MWEKLLMAGGQSAMEGSDSGSAQSSAVSGDITRTGGYMVPSMFQPNFTIPAMIAGVVILAIVLRKK